MCQFPPQNLHLSRSVFIRRCIFWILLIFSSMSRPSYSATNRDIVTGHGAGASTKVGKNRLWNELTESERNAARFLGFNSETWDNDDKVYIDRLTWDELSRAQRKAAKALSFDKKTWNDDVFVDIYERSWGELTDEQKVAARQLGYNKGLWNRDGAVWSDAKAWKDLNPEQQAAAAVLGFAPQEWDDTRRVYEKSWAQLNQVQRIAAEELGYNQRKWDRDKRVPIDDLLWNQLSPRQRWAAKVIGFKEQSWDDATRAGSHATDSEQARRKGLRSQNSCQGVDILQLLFSFGRRDCSRAGKPWYVPDFMGSQWYNFLPPTSF